MASGIAPAPLDAWVTISVAMRGGLLVAGGRADCRVTRRTLQRSANAVGKIARASRLRHHRRMVGLSDKQLSIVLDTARGLPLEKRDVYLQRVGALLMSGARRITIEDVQRACEHAARGLMQTTASVA